MDRFIRLAKLDRLIKEGAKKSDDLAALRSIFMEKYRGERSAAGLAQQYYDRFIGKSDLNAPVLTLDTLPQPLPDTVEELISLLRDENTSKLLKEIKSAYPDISLDSLSQQYLSWIHSRYISKEKREIHPIEESIVTLRKFREIQDKFKDNEDLKQKIVSSGYRDISSIENLSVDEMERIISIDNPDLTVKVHGVEISEKEFLGKFGEWNLWLPHTKETSVKIAGYDPVTYEPDTTWCTARTRGSNLFYNYIGRADAPSFLFYIIKDNPQSDDDWLSLGYISSGTRLSPDFSGQDGGLSVNRANKGLTEEDYQRILGDLWSQIKSRIEGEIENFKREDGEYESPARSIVLELAKDVVKFKKDFYPKSIRERIEFIDIIFGSDPSDDVKREIYKYLAEKHTGTFLAWHREEAKSSGFTYLVKQALEAYAKENPKAFLDKYIDEAKSLGLVNLVKQVLESIPDHDLIDTRYREEAKRLGLVDLVKQALEAYAKQDPDSFLSYYIKEANDLGLVDLVKQTLEVIAKRNPYSFLSKHREEAKRLGLVDLDKQALEAYAKQWPNSFLIYYIKEAKRLGLVDLVKQALEVIAKENPKDFLDYYREEAQSLGLDPDELVGKQASLSNHLIKLSKALESIGMKKEASRVKHLLNIR